MGVTLTCPLKGTAVTASRWNSLLENKKRGQKWGMGQGEMIERYPGDSLHSEKRTLGNNYQNAQPQGDWMA